MIKFYPRRSLLKEPFITLITEMNTNSTRHVVMDLLNTVEFFNIIDDVRNLIEREHIFLKTVWKKRV